MAGVIVKRLHQFISWEAIDLRVINHILPFIVFVENLRVYPAEVNYTILCSQARDQPGVIRMHMRNHEIRLGKINFKLGQAFLHRFPADFTVKAGIDDQIAVVCFDDKGVEFFERAVGQGHPDAEEMISYFFNHENISFLELLNILNNI